MISNDSTYESIKKQQKLTNNRSRNSNEDSTTIEGFLDVDGTQTSHNHLSIFVPGTKDSTNNLHELKSNKDDFLKSLRYFQKRSNEINLTHLIYIEEDIVFELQ